MTDLRALESELLAAVAAADNEDALEAVRVAALGRNGSISALLKTLGTLPPEHRKEQGASINGVKDRISAEPGKPLDLNQLEKDIGGAFGMKTPVYPEYPALLVAARELGRPVHWMASRAESFLTRTAIKIEHVTWILGSKSITDAVEASKIGGGFRRCQNIIGGHRIISMRQ